MATQYTWKINNLIKRTVSGQDDVVTRIGWTCVGTDGNCVGYVSGNTPVAFNPANFTPFSSLSESAVLGWLQDAIAGDTLNKTKETIEKQISGQKNKENIVKDGSLPWENT